MRLRGSPVVRVAVPAVCLAVSVVGAAATSRALTGHRSEAPPADVWSLEAPAVASLTVESGARRVELVRSETGWTAVAGGSPEVEALMADMQSRLFPLQGYRALDADTSAPDYGLASPEITVSARDTRGEDHRVLLGAATFTNGGVYARRADDTGRLYLVPRRMMDDLRSLLAGRRIDSPNDLPDKLKEKTPEHDPASWWLRQSLTAEAGR